MSQFLLHALFIQSFSFLLIIRPASVYEGQSGLIMLSQAIRFSQLFAFVCVCNWKYPNVAVLLQITDGDCQGVPSLSGFPYHDRFP